MASLTFLLLIILLSSALQTSTGFGFSIMTVPFLLFIYDAHEAVVINTVLSCLLSLFMFYRIRTEMDTALLKRLLTGSFIGMPAGLLVYQYLPVETLKLGVGICILLFTVLLLLHFQVKPSPLKDRIVGGISGFLSTAIGIPGPPLLAYFSGMSIDKTALRSTTLAYYISIYTVSAIFQLSLSRPPASVWTSIGLSIPLVAAGILLGQWLFKHIQQQLFRRICLVILCFTGIQLLYSSL
ncbi:sulfite exporter TauE/SafE family protein [Paenibacillus cremeus]|uniref:Probable membrane transporter protein n=1 Tax=Paenibacillus cremeus TaxID=2163881 RepID=A0A559KAW3_9BACL|nr:sulfite exporter TauE/SafE family protein [Paenibacillus cremeus]TVY09239.1 sulfite exporter TauE/SafE family protein [Paenibacillus cremeus]